MPAGVVAPLASTAARSRCHARSTRPLQERTNDLPLGTGKFAALGVDLVQVTPVGVSEIALLSPGFSFQVA